MRVSGRAEPVELLADLPGQHAEVAGVDADRAEPGAGDRDGVGHAGRDVVGVDQQRGAGAQRRHLGAERGRSSSVAVVQQREGVRAGALGRHAVAALRPRGWTSRRTRRGRRRGRRRRRLARGCGASPSP